MLKIDGNHKFMWRFPQNHLYKILFEVGGESGADFLSLQIGAFVFALQVPKQQHFETIGDVVAKEGTGVGHPACICVPP